MKNVLKNQLAAGEVMTRRMAMMWINPLAAASQKEAVRMVAEKQAAAAEAAMAFSLSMAEETWKFWSGAAFGRIATDPVEKEIRASLRKAAVPVNLKVRANRKRLAG